MAYMDLAVYCSRNAVKCNPSLASSHLWPLWEVVFYERFDGIAHGFKNTLRGGLLWEAWRYCSWYQEYSERWSFMRGLTVLLMVSRIPWEVVFYERFDSIAHGFKNTLRGGLWWDVWWYCSWFQKYSERWYFMTGLTVLLMVSKILWEVVFYERFDSIAHGFKNTLRGGLLWEVWRYCSWFHGFKNTLRGGLLWEVWRYCSWFQESIE